MGFKVTGYSSFNIIEFLSRPIGVCNKGHTQALLTGTISILTLTYYQLATLYTTWYRLPQSFN